MQIESLFIFILIISGNFLAELFPCRFQKKLADVVALKHFFGLLTLLFFVVMQTPLNEFTLIYAIKNTLMLYFIFLVVINTDYSTFISCMVLLAVSYLITLKIKENTVFIDKSKNEQERVTLVNQNNHILRIQKCMHAVIIIIITLGFLSYLGSKKSEYSSRFNYFTFIFGKAKCANDGSKLPYIKGILNAFS